jgi:WD40 repeat protein
MSLLTAIVESPSVIHCTPFTHHSPPLDILRRICSFLEDSKDVVHFGLVNRRLTVLLLDAEVWNALLHKHFPASYVVKLPSKTESASFYKRLTTITNNIRAGEYELREFDARQGWISCMTVCGDKLISGSRSKAIKVWDFHSGQELLELKGHQDWISCITTWGNKLISVSGCVIKIWDLHTGQELLELKGHQDWINCMEIWGGRLVSGSEDGMVKIWDLHTGQELLELKGHQSCIYRMAIWRDNLITSSKDGAAWIWNLQTGQELRMIKKDYDAIKGMIIWDDKLIVYTALELIKIWDLNTEQELCCMRKNWMMSIDCMVIWVDRLLLSSCHFVGGNCNIEIWDLNRRQKIQELSYKSKVRCMAVLNEGKFFSGSFDNSIGLWDFGAALNPSERDCKILTKRIFDDDKFDRSAKRFKS